MAEGEGAFCLKWDDFMMNLGSIFSNLRSNNNFTDVTLACMDGQVEAHKLVLAASSPFFASILVNPHPHPLIYLKDIKITNLASLLDFMYHGRAEVARDNMQAFLATARDLQVKGLVEKQKHEDNKTSRSKYENNLVEIKEEVGEESCNDSFQEDWNVNKLYDTKDDSIEEPAIKKWTDFEKFCTKAGRKGNKVIYTCSLCGATKNDKGPAMEHVESAHFKGTFSYPCKICGSVIKTKGAFRQHSKLKHKKPGA